ncbi:MAG: prolipoprotein diacylglyceryl transferase [Candidatus Bipolaricaulota bacterium]|nr:prolipoprotein diacylglyceryl transferase [Candidatus Bipolaricaulota bacterium]
MNPVLVEIPMPFGWNSLQIRYYGVMYVVAILVGIWLTRRLAARRGLSLTLDDVLDFVLMTVPVAIVGARLYYVAFQWSSFYVPDNLWQTLTNIIAIWEGGLAIHGGILAGLLMLWVFCRVKRVSLWAFADAVAPSMILGQALGRFGNFMNGDAYGTPIGPEWPAWLDWVGVVYAPGTPGHQQWGHIPSHPTMLYEMVGDLMIFGILLWLGRKNFQDGFITALYAILYSVLRFGIEFLRADALWLIPDTLRAAQVISVLFIVIFGVLIFGKKLYTRRLVETPSVAAPQGEGQSVSG